MEVTPRAPAEATPKAASTSAYVKTDAVANQLVAPAADDDNASVASSEDEYFSMSTDSDNEGADTEAKREAREKERQRVLEAAGLIVKSDRKPPPRPPKRDKKSKRSRRPPPAAPSRIRDSVASTSSLSLKELPSPPEPELEPEDPHAQLNDAFARYESFKLGRESNRLSFASSMESFPTTTPTPPPLQLADSRDRDSESSWHLSLRGLLGRRTPANDETRRPNITISGPISGPVSALSTSSTLETASQDSGPSFGSVGGPSCMLISCLMLVFQVVGQSGG